MTRLDEIAARLQAATPGPWEVSDDFWPTYTRIDTDGRRRRYGICGATATRAEADLIAHAPADLAALLRVARTAERWERGVGSLQDIADAVAALESEAAQ